MAKVKKWIGSFTTVPNSIAFENRLSWKAKGIFLYMQAKPSDWDFNSIRMAQESSDGRDSTREGLKELIRFGYLKQFKLQSGKVEYELIEPETEIPTDGKAVRRKSRPIINKDIKQIKNITNTGEASSPFVWEEYLVEMARDKRRGIKIIRAFFKVKNITFDSLEKVQAAIQRHIKDANKLLPFNDEEIISTMKKLNYDFPKFTIGTVLKELTK